MTDNITIDYDGTQYPVINAFLNAKDTSKRREIIGIRGPFGSGKSTASIMKLQDNALHQKPMPDGVVRTRHGIVRNTFPQLRDTTIKTVFEWFPPRSCGLYVDSKHEYTIKGRTSEGIPFESMFLFRALDRPEHVQNLLSMELTDAWINEAREVPYEIVKGMFGRIGRFPSKASGGATRKQLLCDTNSPPKQSWWYDLFEVEKPKNVVQFVQPSGLSAEAENIMYLDGGREYYQDLMEVYSEDEIKVYVHGEYGFIKTGRAVYVAYRDNTHCKPVSPAEGVLIYRLWDFGLTPACVFIQFKPDGHVIVFREVCSTRSGIDRFSDEILGLCSREYKDWEFEDIGDPSGDAKAQTDERSCFDILRGKGIDIVGGEMNPTIRQQAVDLALRTLLDDGMPMLLLDPGVEVLREGFLGGYQFKKRAVLDSAGDVTYSDKPDKNRFSHPHDALQHGLGVLLADLLRDRRPQDQKLVQTHADDFYDPLAREDEYSNMQASAIDYDPLGR